MVGRILLITTIASALLAGPVRADGNYALELRAALLSSRSASQQEIVAGGAQLRRYLDHGWFVAAAVDNLTSTLDEPARILGVTGTQGAEISLSRFAVSAHLGRNLGTANARWRWLWSLGLGAALPKSTRAAGFSNTGQRFDVQVEAGTEVHLLGSLGATYLLTPRLSIEVIGRLEHHFQSLTFQDLDSGATRDFRSQTPTGVQLGISYAF